MKQKIYLIILLMTTIASCTNAQTSDYTTFKKQQEQDYARLDSLAASYTTMPAYYVQISSYGCLYDVSINDVYTDRITNQVDVQKALTPISAKILQSGKQRVKVILKPYDGWKAIVDSKPFSIRIGYKDFKEDERNPTAEDVWHWVWESPEVIVPKEGLPYFEIEAEFEAQVPRQVVGWSNCVDLRKIPNIEEMVVAEFKRIRQLIVDKKVDELEMLLWHKNYDVDKAFYMTSQEAKTDWANYRSDIENSEPEEWQPIEDYKLVFSADGRLATLESTKEGGFYSALLNFREEDIPGDDENYNLYFKVFDMRLGMLKGSDKLIPIR